MDKIAELLQTSTIIPIGIYSVYVANFLLNTNRVLKAIELCKECLILLNALKTKKGYVRSIYMRIYLTMFVGYIFTSDHRSGIECGEKRLVLIREYDMKRCRGFYKAKSSRIS